MAELGILFDIDELGGGSYGRSAYRILFRCLDRRALRGASFHDGDTWATLNSGARIYCIAIEAPSAAVISDIEKRLAAATDPGLCSPKSRFLRGDVVADEPLVFAGRVDKVGRLIQCDRPWIISAWQNDGNEDEPTTHPEMAPSYADEVFDFAFGNKPEARDFRTIEGLGKVPGLIYGSGGTKDIGQAEALIRSAMDEMPDFSFVHSWLATILGDKGDFSGARATLIKAIPVCNQKDYLCGQLGNIELEHGTLRDAIKWWIRSVIIQIQSESVQDHEAFLYVEASAQLYNMEELSKDLNGRYKMHLHGEHPRQLSVEGMTDLIKKVTAEHGPEIPEVLEALVIRLAMWAPRDLPQRVGDKKNIHRRFSRWTKSGVWERIFHRLA